MKILGISRGTKYSPNLANSDAAIFSTVVKELQESGHEVETIHENEMLQQDYAAFDKVFTMARDGETLIALENNASEETRKKFVNSINGTLTCTDKSVMASLMLEEGIPQPDFCYGKKRNLVKSSVENYTDLTTPLWLKNCDCSAITADDTIFCSTEEEGNKAFRNFEERGVETWIAQSHQNGDLIKFYGVEGTDFFHWNYASLGHSKFGHEKVNGKEKGYQFCADKIKRYADKMAQKLNVPIYGGDVIIDERGDFWFIDFNDFPSFSICREKAAKAIALRIVQ